MRKYSFPTQNYGQDCVVLIFDKALVPVVSGTLQLLLERWSWKTPADYEPGYNAIAEMLSQMNNNCLDRLIEGQAQIYRLLDSWINGTQYAVADGVVTPPIPAAPPAGPTAANAARAQLRRLHQLAENAATGAEYAAGSAMEGTVGLDFDGSWVARFLALQGTKGGFFGFGEEAVTIADLLQAGRVNTPQDQGLINDGVQEVLSTVANGGSIAGPLATLLETGTDVATDGGLMAVQIAAAVAQQATAGLLAQQLDSMSFQIDALVQAIDGAGLRSPTKNVLTFLNGGLYRTPPEGEDNDFARIGLVDYLVTRFGAQGVTSPVALLNLIKNYIGPQVNNLTANEQLDAIRQAAGGGGGGAPFDPASIIAAIESLKVNLDCICDALGGGSTDPDPDPTPPAFRPGACGDGFTAPDATSVAIDFSASTTVQWVEWESAGPWFSKQTITIGGVQRSVIALATLSASICCQLSKASNDPGTYSVQLDAILIDGTPAAGQIGEISMDGGNPSQTATAAAKDLNQETQVYKLTVNRIDGGQGSPETYTGPGPVVYVSIGSLG